MPEATEAAPLPSEEERKKFLAEAERATAEAEKHRAEADQFRADTRTSLALAGEKEIDLRLAEIKLEKAERERKAELANDRHHHRYVFKGGIDAASVGKCIDQLNEWLRNGVGDDPKPGIEIIFNSPGGSVVDGFALWDFIKEVQAAGHTVTTKTIGYAASMAGILLQAGDKRVMGAESWLMLHEASFGAGGKIGDVEDTVEWVKKVMDRIIDIFAARSKLSKTQLRSKMRRKDWWISSTEAAKLGLIDEVG